MEMRLKCVLLLSLKEISLRRVAVLLIRDSDILAFVSSFSAFNYSTHEIEEWRGAVDDRLKDKMLKLELPELLTNQMIELVGPMSLEVNAWKVSEQYLIRDPNNEIGLPDSAKLCWTTAGTINYRETAEELLRCDKLNVWQRFKVACCYCLESHISLYWEELPEEYKRCEDRGSLSSWLTWWPYILKGKHSELDNRARKCSGNWTSFNQLAFEVSAEGGYETATKYFFQKLTHEEREASLTRTADAVILTISYPNEIRSNLLLYLLSLMTLEQQMEIMMTFPVVVFLCFLRSQLRGIFLENAGLLWALFPPSHYIYLLGVISEAYSVAYFPKMFREFFMASPQDFKTCFVDETDSRFPQSPAVHFLGVFFSDKDSESIEVLFRNVDAAARVKLVRNNFLLFHDYMSRDEWPWVGLCLREAALSEEDGGRLRDDFARFLERRGSSKRDFKRFFEFLGETDASSDK